MSGQATAVVLPNITLPPELNVTKCITQVLYQVPKRVKEVFRSQHSPDRTGGATSGSKDPGNHDGGGDESEDANEGCDSGNRKARD